MLQIEDQTNSTNTTTKKIYKTTVIKVKTTKKNITTGLDEEVEEEKVIEQPVEDIKEVPKTGQEQIVIKEPATEDVLLQNLKQENTKIKLISLLTIKTKLNTLYYFLNWRNITYQIKTSCGKKNKKQ